MLSVKKNENNDELEMAITEHKQIKEELRKSEEQFRGAFETSLAGMALHSMDGTYQQVNQTFCNNVGYSESELLQMNWRDLTPADDIQRIEALNEQVTTGALEKFVIEKPYIHKDGHIVWARIASAQLRDEEGVPQYVLVQIYDISDKKRAEKKIEAQRDELAKLNHQKDKFFEIIAHDLKSPFTALLGFSKILSVQAKELDADQVAEYGSMVHRAADQAFKLLEDLLDWSRLQLDRMEFELAPFDVSKLIKANLLRFEPVAASKGIQIGGDTVQELGVYADTHMVDTILRNLISNAIKFTEAGEEISVGAKKNGEWIEVSVKDTGVGISPEKIKDLFTLGQKISTKGTRGESGTGLGLQLCKELVEKQGGEIHVESIEGKGSTFCFTLPVPPD